MVGRRPRARGRKAASSAGDDPDAIEALADHPFFPIFAKLRGRLEGSGSLEDRLFTALQGALEAGDLTQDDLLDALLPAGIASPTPTTAGPSSNPIRVEANTADAAAGLIGAPEIASLLEGTSEQRRASRAEFTQQKLRVVRWVGARREMMVGGGEGTSRLFTWVAWCIEGSISLAVAADVFPGTPSDVVLAEQLRAALDSHRGKPAEPKGGLSTSDARLAPIARRVIGGAPPVSSPSYEAEIVAANAFAECRITAGLEAREPSLWLRAREPEVARVLRAASRLFATTPWEYPFRTFVRITLPSRGVEALFLPLQRSLGDDAREVVFSIAPIEDHAEREHDEEADAQRPVDSELVVLLFVEETTRVEQMRVLARGMLHSAGWTEPRWFPYVQVHGGREIDRALTSTDFELAYALVESLALVLADRPSDADGAAHYRWESLPELDVEVHATWFCAE